MANRSSPVHVRSSSRPLTMSASDEPKLPQDVVVEILKRLPVESLLRCRCVSRSWRSAIDDPRFVALHLNHSALDPSNWHLACLHWGIPVEGVSSLFSIESLTLPSQSQIEIPFPAPYRVVGSCNGLICVEEFPLYGHGKMMYVWNLFTRKHKAVPRSGVERPYLYAGTTRSVLGFGFDARSNDYKIVRILYFPDAYLRNFGGPQARVHIYSLRTDSWRSLECGVPALRCARALRGVFLNGNLHWFASKVDDLGNDVEYGPIVLFDVAGEVFDEMALPPVEISRLDTGKLMMSMAVLNDLLAVFVCLKDLAVDNHSVCSVWVMREYGVSDSWAKLYSFEPWGLVSRFDGFTRNGELLMVICPRRRFSWNERVSWNPIMGQHATLPLSTECYLITIVESLVSL